MEKLKYRKRSISPARCFSICLCLFLAFPATAQDLGALPLDSVLSRVKQNNLSLREIQAQVNAAQSRITGSRSWMAPMAGAGTFMAPYPGQTAMPENKGALMLSFEQEIPSPARQKAREEIAQKQINTVAASRGIQQNILLSAARLSYRQLVLLNYRRKTLEENLLILQTTLKLANIRYTYNQGKLQETYLNEARIAEVENMLIMTKAQEQQQLVRLKTLMNLPEGASFRVENQDWSAPVLLSPDSAQIAGRSDLKQMEASIQTMQSQQKLMQLGSRPDFKVRYDHMSPLGEGMPQQYSLMGMLSIPIVPWASRMYRSENKAMQWEISAMELRRENMLLESRGMAQEMYISLQSMIQQQENYRSKVLPNLEKSLKLEELAYQENNTSLSAVLNAWESLKMAQDKFLEQWMNINLMLADYERELEIQ